MIPSADSAGYMLPTHSKRREGTMTNWKRGGAVAAVAVLTAASLAAHTGDRRSSNGAGAAPRAAARRSAATDYIVGVQMTGLLLLVPSGGKTYVLLPASPSGRPHTALLGFGFS